MKDDLRYYGNPMNWESTKGDLISRSALKKAVEELKRPKAYSEADVRQNVVIDCVLHIINNATTVEIATKLQPNCNKLQQGGADMRGEDK